MIMNAIKNRYSVRRFANKPIEPEKLDALLDAARLAPSARNIQPWTFVAITDAKQRAALTYICKGQTFVSQAPVTIAICVNNTDYTMTCGQTGAIIDGAIAGEHIALQAAELGLGTCWIGAFSADQLATLIHMPADYRVVGLLPVGYPDIPKGNRSLKPREETVKINHF